MSGCAGCDKRSPRMDGVLCASCVTSLVIGERRAPGIVSTRDVTASAWLIDAWGQLHPIGERARIGRDRHNDVVIADLTVSGEHAELARTSGRWGVVDRGSSNGTAVAGRSRVRTSSITHRERIAFGSIAFRFWAAADPPARRVPSPSVKTVVPAGSAYALVGPLGGAITIRAARDHDLAIAPGELGFTPPDRGRTRKAVLPRLQFQLMRVLCEAAATHDDARSAFVPSDVLVRALPFRTARPSSNHVRQVVATLRERLAEVGVTNGDGAGDEAVIQGKEGHGYRVTWIVTPLAERT